MQEAVDEDYLHYRIASTHYVGQHLRDAGVPLLWPTGGHAIYLDAKRIAAAPRAEEASGRCRRQRHVPGRRRAGLRDRHPDVRVARSRDRGGSEGPRELVRLAIPRRTYTQSHMDYVIEVVTKVWEERESLPGYRIVEQAPFLRHFSAKLEPLV